MKKLAAELYDKIIDSLTDCNAYGDEQMYKYEDIKAVLKLFLTPVVVLHIKHDECIRIYADFRNDAPVIVSTADSTVSEFTVEQFKDFIVGCTKILEHVNA